MNLRRAALRYLATLAEGFMLTRPTAGWSWGAMTDPDEPLHLVRDALPTPDTAAGGATPTRPVRRGSPRRLS